MALTEKLSAIADGVRALTGGSEKLTLEEMAAEMETVPNFTVCAGIKPEQPAENTLWVDTEAEITGWVFRTGQPEQPQEGMVWFCTAPGSAVSFDALKKNPIQVCLRSAKQYTGGAWVRRDAQLYQQGSWTEIVTYLYNRGNLFADLTGGWRLDCGRTNSTSSPYVIGTGELDDDAITLTVSKKWQSIQAATKNKISFGGFHKICCQYSYAGNGGGGNLRYGSGITMDSGIAQTKLEDNSGQLAIAELDISVETGSYYVAVNKFTNSENFGTTTIHRVWLE